MKEKILVKDYNRLIHKMTWRYSNKWNVEESEMYAEGLYIFVLTLNRFEERKSQFITYLHHRLEGKLDKYGSRESEQTHRCLPCDRELPSGWHDLFVRGLEFYESASTELSEDAKEVLGVILRSLEDTYPCKPCLHGMIEHFQSSLEWPSARTKRAWNRVKDWWKEFNLSPLRV